MKKAFVAGWPISHSLSPHLHGFWLQQYGINGSYEAVAVEPEKIDGFLATIADNGYAGGNVTIPHKHAALKACDKVDDEALAIGAVNTVWLDDGLLRGTNTDSYGFAANLDQALPQWRSAETAIVFGAGGASRAVIHALLAAGLEVHLVNRTLRRAEELAADFGSRVTPNPWEKADSLLPECGLLVNTTSLGMHGQEPLPINLNHAGPDTIVTDIVYNPLETPLLKKARSKGLKVVDGLGMLMHQAVPGFEKWFGRRPVVDEKLRSHLLDQF